MRDDNILREKKINKDDPERLNELRKKNDSKFYWKFHGDVEDIDDTEWIIEENGKVFKCFEVYLEEEYINKALEEPFIFIIAGYSERDKEIKQKIIEK